MKTKTMALLIVCMLLVVACAKKEPMQEPKPAPTPSAPEPVENEVVQDMGALDETSEDINVESLDSLDSELAQIEDLDY